MDFTKILKLEQLRQAIDENVFLKFLLNIFTITYFCRKHQFNRTMRHSLCRIDMHFSKVHS